MNVQTKFITPKHAICRLQCNDVRAIVETVVTTTPDLIALTDVSLCYNDILDDGASHLSRLLEVIELLTLVMPTVRAAYNVHCALVYFHAGRTFRCLHLSDSEPGFIKQ